MLSELEWPSLETRREQFSLTLFYKIHFGTVYIDKDKHLTPALGLKQTGASQSHDSHYSRYLAPSDALKNSFFPLFCGWGQDRRRIYGTYVEYLCRGMCLSMPLSCFL